MAAGSKAVKTYLYINGVSSRDLMLALVSREKILKQRIVEQGTRTEKLLPAIMSFLGKKIPAGIIVAQGGGSFSQTRVVCAIANALAYGWGIKVVGVASSFTAAQIMKKLPKLRWQRLLLPTYSGPGVG